MAGSFLAKTSRSNIGHQQTHTYSHWSHNWNKSTGDSDAVRGKRKNFRCSCIYALHNPQVLPFSLRISIIMSRKR